MSSALVSPGVLAVDPQLVITAIFVGWVVIFGIGITWFVLHEEQHAELPSVPGSKASPPDAGPGHRG